MYLSTSPLTEAVPPTVKSPLTVITVVASGPISTLILRVAILTMPSDSMVHLYAEIGVMVTLYPPSPNGPLSEFVSGTSGK
ncbi:hypothetical protein ES703_95783 [subsurface metagenome]